MQRSSFFRRPGSAHARPANGRRAALWALAAGHHAACNDLPGWSSVRRTPRSLLALRQIGSAPRRTHGGDHLRCPATPRRHHGRHRRLLRAPASDPVQGLRLALSPVVLSPDAYRRRPRPHLARPRAPPRSEPACRLLRPGRRLVRRTADPVAVSNSGGNTGTSSSNPGLRPEPACSTDAVVGAGGCPYAVAVIGCRTARRSRRPLLDNPLRACSAIQ